MNVHVLFAVGAVGKAAITVVEFTLEWFLARVSSLVDLEVLGASKDFTAAYEWTREWLFASVNANVIDKLVFGLEGLALADTIAPVTDVYILITTTNMVNCQMGHYFVHAVEDTITHAFGVRVYPVADNFWFD